MREHTILIVDDEPAQRNTLSGYLKKKSFHVLTAENGQMGVNVLEKQPVDIVLTDMRMPGKSGLELLQESRRINPDVSVVLITAFSSVEDAVDAMKAGAEDYIQKPIDLDYLDIVLKKIALKKRLISENRLLKESLQSRHDFRQIIATSPNMESVLNMAARAAESRAPVLLRGESGTGKEVIARAIHFASQRKEKPFVPVNVAAVAETLLESEFFGHEKGAFTGADRQRKGRFETAHQGTLFIDEIGDIPGTSQVKLLRALQEQTFERVGGSETLHTDVRIISATHKNLEEMIEQSLFREDLYYRLNVITIHLPPLRERREDIPLLIDFFLQKYSAREGREIRSLSKEAMDLLMKHDYKGNVRELENIIQRGIVMARTEVVTSDDLPPHLGALTRESDMPLEEGLGPAVENLERRMIRHALNQAKGNQSQAARLLSLTERNLRYKMKKYGM